MSYTLFLRILQLELTFLVLDTHFKSILHFLLEEFLYMKWQPDIRSNIRFIETCYNCEMGKFTIVTKDLVWCKRCTYP